MVAETRSRTRKIQNLKANVTSASSSRQRTLKDMFGAKSKQTEDVMSMQIEVPVIEVQDSSSEAEGPLTIPSTPEEVVGTLGEESVVLGTQGGVFDQPDQLVQPTHPTQPVQATQPFQLAQFSQVPSISPMLIPPIQPTNPPERQVPKKVYSIFERPKPSHKTNHTTVLQGDNHDSIYISDDDSCTEEAAPYQRGDAQHLFSVPPSNEKMALSRHGSVSDISTNEPQWKLRSGRPSTSKTSSSKAVYSIFAPKQKIEPKAATNLSGQVAPFPDQESQHVHGLHPRTASSHRSLYSARPDKGNAPPREHCGSDYSLARLCSPPTISHSPTQDSILMDGDINTYIDTIPRSDLAAPSISRILQHVKSATESIFSTSATHEKWTDKWRPKRAEQVIGNESHALYLRDWLLALRLQNDARDISHSSQSTGSNRNRKRKLARKKPRVVRHVKKQRRGSNVSIDDFVASDGSTDFEEEPLTAPSSDFDDLAFSDGLHSESNGNFAGSSRGSSPLTGLSEDERSMTTKPPPRRFGRRLMNTILLAGPSGIGKTASVYACAEELGYEVFEVYPGMGERNGASLNKLVGDVGKNHVVTMKRRRSPEMQRNFFQRKAPRKAANGLRRIPDSSDVESMPDELDIITQSEPEEDPEPSQPTITQSLILVEEVDILFQTDSNFWSGLINIIKDCRRPVILTCNDISLVPCHDLPLQDTLRFQPCSLSLAISYLQALCLAEGRRYPRHELARIYTNLDNLSYPYYDLRHAIDHLQVLSTKIPAASLLSRQSHVSLPEVDCISIQANTDTSTLPPSESNIPSMPSTAAAIKDINILQNMERIREVQSYVDAHFTSEPNSCLWNLFLADHPSSASDELGYTVLHSNRDVDFVPVSSLYQQGENIADDLLQRSHKAFRQENDIICSQDIAAGLEVNRRIYHATAGVVLSHFSSLHFLPSELALHLDFAPWVRYIMDVDTAQKTQVSRTGSQGRTTRNSQRDDIGMCLFTSDAERAIFSNTRLRLDGFV